MDTGPTFQWVDQTGQFFSSDKLPFETGFIGGNVTASGAGGLLPIVPLFGGSGPQNLDSFPLPPAPAPWRGCSCRTPSVPRPPMR